MEEILAAFAALSLSIAVGYAVLKPELPSGVRYYVLGSTVLLAGTLTVALVRLVGLLPPNLLLDAGIVTILVATPLGFLLALATGQKESRQLRLLRSAANLLMPSNELGPLLQQVLDIAHAAVRVDGSSIMLLDENSRELRFVAARGIDPALVHGYKVAIDHPAIARVWSGQGPLLIPDVNRQPEFRQILVRPGIRSFFAMPMVTRDTLVGFLNVHRTRASTLAPEEIDLLNALACQAAVGIYQSRLYRDLHKRYLDTVGVLASAMEVNDPHTLGHARQVATISRLIGEELDLPSEMRETIEVAALMHDVGKLGISNSVLRKLGQLSPEERVEVRSHAMLGSMVLREAESLRDALPAVLHHHERWDGRGYPHGLRGEEIPLLARIIATADAYEVMTAGRAYRAARRPEDAISELKREAGRQFDPAIVDAMVRLYERGELAPIDVDRKLRGEGEPRAAAS